MKKLIKPLYVALSTCLLLLPFSSCKKNDDGMQTLQVNEVTHSIFYAPLYLADSLGYFAEEGIKKEGFEKTITKSLPALRGGATKWRRGA